ncbi:tyrosine-protein phosphatase [Lacticaseibacillus parakribbianus]|uniref:tyrosine-protein phosphatase n=1 Tax=Lacticaseibacillus parakribbianus TaxID=2970927 RepID=UPI0021CB519A|nr:tyrosine-protein phosphatase [Lacticaseibacillus parakribbianus]
MSPDRLLPLQNALNVRDLGGYQTQDGRTVAWRRLVRAGSLSNLSPADGAVLLDYGVTHDLDLRSDAEVRRAPDQLPERIRYRQLSVYPFADRASLWTRVRRRLSKAPTGMVATYEKMLTDSHANAVFGEVFATVLAAAPGEATLFHCTAGKDRTGVAAMMLLGGLGVPAATIQADYMLTNQIYDAAATGVAPSGSATVDAMNAHPAEAANYQAVVALLAKNYGGSWSRYLTQQLRLSEGDLADLRRLYLV